MDICEGRKLHQLLQSGRVPLRILRKMMIERGERMFEEVFGVGVMIYVWFSLKENKVCELGRGVAAL